MKAPLLTLMAGGNPEVEYCILKHMEAMIHRCPGVFDDEYRQVQHTPWLSQDVAVGMRASMVRQEAGSLACLLAWSLPSCPAVRALQRAVVRQVREDRHPGPYRQ